MDKLFQNRNDKAVMLRLLINESKLGNKQFDIFTRENQVVHFTASSWLVNKERTKVLMIYHNIYNSWSWTGGHADGERDLLAVAMKEAKEETGVQTIIPVREEIFSIEILTVDGHRKHGIYGPSHLHLNVTYLLEADHTQALRVKPDENSAVAWIAVEDIPKKSTEHWFVKRIYPKLCEKAKNR